MRAGSLWRCDLWTAATATKRLARHPRLPPHFRAYGKRFRTDVDALRQKLKDRRRVRWSLRCYGTEGFPVEVFLLLPYSISFSRKGSHQNGGIRDLQCDIPPEQTGEGQPTTRYGIKIARTS